MKPSNEQRAAAIEVVVFDVDGVLTRGEIMYAGSDAEIKVFDVQDGQGFTLARQAGLRLGMITGRTSQAVQRRAKELKVDMLMEGQLDKGAALRELMSKLRVKPSQVCYVGDDLPDIAALMQAGLAVAVHNAVAEVKAVAHVATDLRGGEGAAREVIEFILKAKGLWTSLIKSYVDDRA